MCGILGIIAPFGRAPSVDDRCAETMRDRLTHRGPDGCGLWRRENVLLAHRRLAVVDLSPAGRQPMLARGGRSAIVYNGELYNDGELRAELAARGVEFRSRSDAETVLAMLDAHGAGAIPRLRGMYAVGYVNFETGLCLLARDPLGVKPLYYATPQAGGESELVFASEINAILAHPSIAPRPDAVTISSYLTTIRTTLGPRTLFAGISTLEPGEVLTVDLRRDRIVHTRKRWWGAGGLAAHGTARRAAVVGDVRAAVADSVRRHLRADVPVCCLLSGGLDSSIIAMLARSTAEPAALRTYSAGCPEGGGENSDLDAAKRVAAMLGSTHAEAVVTRDLFATRWPEMVEAGGLPLSTPNQVAINAVARRLREDGQVVALSGEGADELFGGYETPLSQSVAHLGAMAGEDPDEWRRAGGLFQLDMSAWVARVAKAGVLAEDALRGAESDHYLSEFYISRFKEVASAADEPTPAEAHLRFSREINLTGLLLRLDHSTMLEGVEGRTPFADQHVAATAASVPFDCKFQPAHGGPADEPMVAAQTKIALRSAFGADLPSIVLARPKASFPLPFQGWLADQAAVMHESHFARSFFTDAAVAATAHSPERFWPVAWPVINLALWGRRWWG